MDEPNILEVTKVDFRGCCYNERGDHEGSFEPMPLSNDDIAGYFLEYVAEKLPTLVKGQKNKKTTVCLK